MEGEPSLVRTLSDRLASEGYEIEAAGDADAALDLAVRRPFDLVILDIMLPGRDGFEVCRELRQREFDMPIGVIPCSNHSFPGKPTQRDLMYQAPTSRTPSGFW